MEYAIHESNIERLEKKLTRIANKCKKFGIDFHYEQKGETFKEFTNPDTGDKEVRRYILVEADGKAELNGWEFVATLEHTEEGNIIKGYGEYEVPERYYECEPICEHCNSRRNRKSTYIVYNSESNEFKQVGKSCLADFTHGLDAEGVAQYISCFDELIQGEAIGEGHDYSRYFELNEMLCYFNETIKHFGYVKNNYYEYSAEKSTSNRASDYYCIDKHETKWWTQKEIDTLKEEMRSVGFKADTEENNAKAKDMVEWILKQDNDSNYFHNLKVICKQKYINSDNFGLVASIPATYDKTLQIEAERREKELRDAKIRKCAKWVGEVGKRVTFKVEDSRVLASRDTQWGYTYFIQFTDADGNVYVWSTSNGTVTEAKEITATIKEHTEYKGTKQNVITRGRVVA